MSGSFIFALIKKRIKCIEHNWSIKASTFLEKSISFVWQHSKDFYFENSAPTGWKKKKKEKNILKRDGNKFHQLRIECSNKKNTKRNLLNGIVLFPKYEQNEHSIWSKKYMCLCIYSCLFEIKAFWWTKIYLIEHENKKIDLEIEGSRCLFRQRGYKVKNKIYLNK